MKLFIPSIIAFRVILSFFQQRFKDSFRHVVFDFGHESTILVVLPGNIEGDIFTVDDTLKETEKIRDEEFLAILFNQNFF